MSAIDRTPLITSVANPVVKAAAKLVTRKGRRDQGRFLVEGPRAVADGLAHLETLFVTEAGARDHDHLIAALLDQGTDIRLVSNEVLAAIGDTVTPQGMIGVAPIQAATLDEVLQQDPKLIVVLDQISDPGNAGTIIRTADAAGANAVILFVGSTDPYSPKAIRSSVGSVFHLPIVVAADPAETFAALAEAGMTRLCAQVHEGDDVFDQVYDAPVALVFGGEAVGLSQTSLESCDQLVRIPMPETLRPGYSGHAESLNLSAAAAIMTFTVARNQQHNASPSAS